MIKKVKILFIAPFFEIQAGYLIRALSKFFDIETIPTSWRSVIIDEIPKKFPKNILDIKRYDVVIFSDVGRHNFADKELNLIKEYTLQGGGFLMIGGWASFTGHDKMGNYHNSPIEEILPVSCFSEPDDKAVPKGFVPRIVDPSHIILRGIDWKTTPVLVGFNKTKIKSNATLLLKYRNYPILAVWKISDGRTAAFTSDAHPHWSGGWTDWRYYSQFWKQLIDWLVISKN